MDYEKLIEHLRRRGLGNGSALGPHSGLYDDAANAIETLRADLDRVTAERDAAVEDLEEIMFKGGHNIDTCEYCKNAKCYARGGIQVCNPVWRGIKEEAEA